MKRTIATVHRDADAPRVFARLPAVIQATGLGRSTIYRLMASGTFPLQCTLARAPSGGGGRTWTDGANLDPVRVERHSVLYLLGDY